MHAIRSILGLVLVLSCRPGVSIAQNLVKNPDIESGGNQPAGWRLTDGAGEWSATAHQGKHSLQVKGNGNDQSVWLSDPLALEPDHLYRLSFYAKRLGDNAEGCAVAGPAGINRDFHLTENWERYSFVFVTPSEAGARSIRLGQWHLNGAAFFDDVELVPVQVLRHHTEAGELDQGESIQGGVYRCALDFGWEGANSHRTLANWRAGFNSDRWVFSPGAQVVYRHQVGRYSQAAGQVRANINYSQGGQLTVEASRDGSEWLALCQRPATNGNLKLDLPPSLFPAVTIFVRLRHSGSAGDFQINRYDYEARLTETAQDQEGESQLVDLLLENKMVTLDERTLNLKPGAGQGHLRLVLSNDSPNEISLRLGWAEGANYAKLQQEQAIRLAPQATSSRAIRFEFPTAGVHERRIIAASAQGEPLFIARTFFKVGFLDEIAYGYRLPDPTIDGLSLWWCESGWKVGRHRRPPSPPKPGSVNPPNNQALHVAAARNEYEAVQLVLNYQGQTAGASSRRQVDNQPVAAGSNRPLTLEQVACGPWVNAQGQTAAINVQVDEVAYVKVEHPTDSAGSRDWFPDPLPPLRTPLPLSPDQNQPLWVTIYVPEETLPGDYHAQVELATSSGKTTVPVQLHVYRFALPKRTHLRSALGLGTHAINTFHHLQRRADQEQVYQQYLGNFAAHRISPYSFCDYQPIDISFTGEGIKKARVDFTRFDQAAHQWLDSLKFNSFVLPLRGMGGGTFYSRHLGELEGFKEGTPEHARLFHDYLSQIETHLRQKGWLEMAYTYWFDEPDTKDYAFVVEGMKRIKEAAPGIKRLLTKQPDGSLPGNVEIWCGLTPEWTPEKVKARQIAGEEVWWYICTGPKAPFVTEFIDHPGLNLRLWPWQSWQYGVTGILIWETLYWTSDAAFPPPRRQNPWQDPMSYVSGYGNQAGFVGYWGNGDGRFLYPPREAMAPNSGPCFAEPVNSFRWENLRDGMEDYEYFWLLRELIQQAEKRSALATLTAEARALLTVPESISKDLTHFTTDPRILLRHRDQLARMIERLTDESASKKP